MGPNSHWLSLIFKKKYKMQQPKITYNNLVKKIRLRTYNNLVLHNTYMLSLYTNVQCMN